MYNYRGPCWDRRLHPRSGQDPPESPQRLDSVIEDVRTKPVTAAELDRARTKLRSNLYNLGDTLAPLGLTTCSRWGRCGRMIRAG